MGEYLLDCSSCSQVPYPHRLIPAATSENALMSRVPNGCIGYEVMEVLAFGACGFVDVPLANGSVARCREELRLIEMVPLAAENLCCVLLKRSNRLRLQHVPKV